MCQRAQPAALRFQREPGSISERWDEVPQFLEASRSYAREAALLALPVHLDRLEGRAALATGNRKRGLELLEQACAGYADRGAAWERARTELEIAEALADAGLEADAHARVGAAIPDIEGVGALIEIARSRRVIGQRGRLFASPDCFPARRGSGEVIGRVEGAGYPRSAA